jgi:hypothetical protein
LKIACFPCKAKEGDEVASSASSVLHDWFQYLDQVKKLTANKKIQGTTWLHCGQRELLKFALFLESYWQDQEKVLKVQPNKKNLLSG